MIDLCEPAKYEENPDIFLDNQPHVVFGTVEEIVGTFPILASVEDLADYPYGIVTFTKLPNGDWTSK